MVNEWQPIETAPKDVRVIVAWLYKNAIERVEAATFESEHDLWFDGSYSLGSAPHLWMPLPEEPKEEGGEL